MSRRYHHPPFSEHQLSNAVGAFKTWDDQIKNHGQILSVEDLVHRIAECLFEEVDLNPKPDRLVYLSSPYNHPDPEVKEKRRKAACSAAGYLIERGIPVHSPIAHNAAILEQTSGKSGWEIWKPQDLALLKASTEMVILCLPGWEASEGIRGEFHAAMEMGKPVSYMRAD
jgi:hypothetical protein